MVVKKYLRICSVKLFFSVRAPQNLGGLETLFSFPWQLGVLKLCNPRSSGGRAAHLQNSPCRWKRLMIQGHREPARAASFEVCPVRTGVRAFLLIVHPSLGCMFYFFSLCQMGLCKQLWKWKINLFIFLYFAFVGSWKHCESRGHFPPWKHNRGIVCAFELSVCASNLFQLKSYITTGQNSGDNRQGCSGYIFNFSEPKKTKAKDS